MALYSGRNAVSRMWSGSDVWTASAGTRSAWTSGVISDWGYQVKNGAAILTLWRGNSAFITAPSRIAGYPVTAMAASACNYARARLAVIPDSVTEIG